MKKLFINLVICLLFYKNAEASISSNENAPQRFETILKEIKNFGLKIPESKDVATNFIDRFYKAKPLWENPLYKDIFKHFINQFKSVMKELIDILPVEIATQQERKSLIEELTAKILPMMQTLIKLDNSSGETINNYQKKLSELIYQLNMNVCYSNYLEIKTGKHSSAFSLTEKAVPEENLKKIEAAKELLNQISRYYNTVYFSDPLTDKLYHFIQNRYQHMKDQRLHWTMLVNYLTDITHETINVDLYEKGLNLFSDLWYAFIYKSFSLDFDSEKQKTKIDYLSTTDSRLLEKFFSILYKKIFTQNDNHNSLDLYAKITAKSRYKSSKKFRDNSFNDLASRKKVSELIDQVKLIFNIECFLLREGTNNSFYKITNKITKKKFYINILFNKDVFNEDLEIVLDENQQKYEMSVSNRYALNSSIYAFAKIMHHSGLRLNSKKNILSELYPVLIEKGFKRDNNLDSPINDKYSELTTLTLFYSLMPYLDDSVDSKENFQKTYFNAFSPKHQRLLELMKKNNNNFDNIIQEATKKEVAMMVHNKMTESFLAQLLADYCYNIKKISTKDLEEIRIASLTLKSMLKYLDITIEDLADYAYHNYRDNYLFQDTNCFLSETSPEFL